MRVASGAVAATVSSPGSHTDESIWAAPNSPAARTTDAAAPGWKLSSAPTGASTTGSRSRRPNAATCESTWQTSRSTRGRKRELIEREPVAPQRGFRLGGADDVVPVVLVEILARLGDDLVQGLEIGSGRRQALRGELFGIAVLHGLPLSRRGSAPYRSRLPLQCDRRDFFKP